MTQPAAEGSPLLEPGSRRSLLIKQESKHFAGSASVHSYSEEEKSGIVDHINNLLKDEPNLQDRLPINTNNVDIFEAVKVGILTWYVRYFKCTSILLLICVNTAYPYSVLFVFS